MVFVEPVLHFEGLTYVNVGVLGLYLLTPLWFGVKYLIFEQSFLLPFNSLDFIKKFRFVRRKSLVYRT